MSPTPTTTPFDCAEPGCTWAVRGVPDKYARILAEEHAAEHAGQAPTTEPTPFRYVDDDGFCLTARLLPDLNAGGTTGTLSMTIEGSDEPQSAHVPVDELPQILAGIAGAAGLERARRVLGTPTMNTETRSCGSAQLHQPHQFMRMEVVFRCPGTAAESARRRLTPSEHDRAWHAIEGSAGEEGADPGTVLNAVLHALRIDAPTAAEEQAASPSRRMAAEAQRPTPDVAEALTDCGCGTYMRCPNGHCSRHYTCQDCGRCCTCECSGAPAATEEPTR
ncbi:hypothetical protein ABT081_02540 [Streptomyces sp. NPDC002238]|uniref:hypothetical protein n=1 Tax=Streptomyces sp. NPDC002238 TaxID=3156649 RepID=UPI00331A014A